LVLQGGAVRDKKGHFYLGLGQVGLPPHQEKAGLAGKYK
jgi:hypothetical protein